MVEGLVSSAPPKAVLAVEHVSKRFGSVVALEDVSLEVQPGEVHCLLGENGAGKSTLCNVIFGVHRPDSGRLALAGAPFLPAGPAGALAAGVAMVHQHFSLVGNMTGLENLCLARRGSPPALLQRQVAALGSRLEFELPLDRAVETLAVGERQRLEIVKCLLAEPRLLVLDEPTAVLPPREVAGLLAICRKVAASGCGILLVTHKLAEIGAIADRTTVLRRGRSVESVDMARADLNALVRSMVGREVRNLDAVAAPAPPSDPARGGPPALALEELTFRDAAGVERLCVSLEVRPGEILGIAGVEGNGQSELSAIIAGLLAPTSGAVRLGGKDVTRAAPRALTASGLGCVPEDRHAAGCHVGLDVAENLFLGELARFTRFGLLDRRALHREAATVLQAFDVRGAPASRMGELSGGNQQKVVLARELSLDPLVCLLASQPTRGLDVGAVEAVYQQIRRVRSRGAGVLLISSELDELLAVADRVLVLYRGRIVGGVPGGREHQEQVGLLMSGRSAEPALVARAEVA